MNKMQKVRLVTLKSSLIVNHNPTHQQGNAQDQIKSIHSYFVMLRHIYQKNKQMIRQRNQQIRQNKSQQNAKQKKTQKKRQLSVAITQHCFGVNKNNTELSKGFKKRNNVRQYKPYRPRNTSISMNYKTISSSLPNIQIQKDIQFTPIGQKYNECHKINLDNKKQALSTTRQMLNKTCIHFHPKYDKGIFNRIQEETKKNQLKKERKILLMKSRQGINDEEEKDFLRISNKSQYSNKSCMSLVTDSTQIPSPW